MSKRGNALKATKVPTTVAADPTRKATSRCPVSLKTRLYCRQQWATNLPLRFVWNKTMQHSCMNGSCVTAAYLRSAENKSKGTAMVSRYLLTMEYSTAVGEINPTLLITRPANVLTSGLHAATKLLLDEFLKLLLWWLATKCISALSNDRWRVYPLSSLPHFVFSDLKPLCMYLTVNLMGMKKVCKTPAEVDQALTTNLLLQHRSGKPTLSKGWLQPLRGLH